MNAQTMHCPTCGAAVGGDHPNCAHCGARLATIACPACFHMMFREGRFCPACGASAVAWAASAGDRLCPGCREPMLRGQLEDILLEECPKCYGLWLDLGTFEKICRNAERSAVTLGAAQALPPQPLAPIRYRPCPACRQLMNRVNFAKSSGVIVDVCRAHGTWFDIHELHRILQFIRAGGLDLAREKAKAELVQEQIRARAERRHSAPGPAPAPASWPASGELLTEVVLAAGDLFTSWLTDR